MCKRITWLLIIVLCLPGMFLAAANAETAPTFLLDVQKATDGKITLTMSGKNIIDLYGYEARFSFDPDKLELVEAKSNRDGFSVSPIIKNNEIIIAHTKVGDVPGESGDVTIGSLKFKIKKEGDSAIIWDAIKVVTHKLNSTTTAVGKSVVVRNPVISLGSKTFVDLVGHWAKEDIELLASRGVIDGMDDTHFMPEDKVTRAEFAAMITRALNLKQIAEGAAETAVQIPFTDVQPASWYAGAVNIAYFAGIIQGITASSFAPERDISREEMAVMIARAGKYASEETFKETDLTDSNATALIEFADTRSISEWAIKDVEWAIRAGIINGRTEDAFVPHAQTSRAEAGVVIKRLLAIIGQL